MLQPFQLLYQIYLRPDFLSPMRDNVHALMRSVDTANKTAETPSPEAEPCTSNVSERWGPHEAEANLSL